MSGFTMPESWTVVEFFSIRSHSENEKLVWFLNGKNERSFWGTFEADYTYLFHKLFLFTCRAEAPLHEGSFT